MGAVKVEIVVQTADDARRATDAGADRLEVCTALEVGGLTPTPGLLREIRRATSLPLAVMVRPRSGDFTYSEADRAAMAADIRWMLQSGADSLVFGVLTPKGEVDIPACAELVESAGGTPCSFHRAFDLVPSASEAAEALIKLGFVRVLTSGGGSTALDGAAGLNDLVKRADGRITILAGGGVRSANVAELVRSTGVAEVHLAPLRERSSPMVGGAYAFHPGWEVDDAEVARVVEALSVP